MHGGQHWYVVGELNSKGDTCMAAYRNYSTVKRKKPRSPAEGDYNFTLKKPQIVEKHLKRSSPKVLISNDSIKLPSLQQNSTILSRDFLQRYQECLTCSHTPSSIPYKSHNNSKQRLTKTKSKLQFRSRRFRTEAVPTGKQPCAWQEYDEPGI